MIWRVYRYYNPIEDKSYIGQTTLNVNDRAGKDGHNYRRGTFREAIDKYGFDKFEQSILRLCTSQEEADQYEKYFIEKYNTICPNGYNLETGGKKEWTMHDETRQKITDSMKGEKNYWYGKYRSEETRTKMADAKKGKPGNNKGHKWFNDGEREVMAYECPEGFVPGRLMKKKCQ